MSNPSTGPRALGASHAREVREGQRFEFGRNWRAFLDVLDERRIAMAEASLAAMLGVKSLRGRTFLDVGCGSGLFSLAARRLGATVRSFDYDPMSVGCAAELRRRYFENDPRWSIEEGSVLDAAFLRRLGSFDIVYSWGVLHHTGAMWEALANVDPLVGPGGQLFIALYNDQGRSSRYWWHVKKAYVGLPRFLRFIVLVPSFLRLWAPTMLRDLLRGRPLATWRARSEDRGMSPYRDVIDWVGGFPFEVCKPEQVFEFFKGRGYELQRLKTSAGGIACNEFVFARRAAP
ncbi:MAG: class I SAM-dependent methyltransferase [Steroidobacteraceae bacterium]